MRRAVEKRANKALNAIDDILIFTDTVGRIVYVNKKAAEVLKNQGVINDPVGLFLLEAWPDSKAQWCRDFDEKGLPVTTANLPLLAIVTAQGVQLYEQSSHPLYEGDSLEGITWVLRDVSAAENAKMDLIRSQERYKILFEEEPLTLSDQCMQKLEESFHFLKTFSNDKIIYGINTVLDRWPNTVLKMNPCHNYSIISSAAMPPEQGNPFRNSMSKLP